MIPVWSRQPEMGFKGGGMLIPRTEIAKYVSRTRCSVLRCTAEPGPIGMLREVWTPDQQRTTPQERRVAQHPGHALLSSVLILDLISNTPSPSRDAMRPSCA
jgi:hypothetical protein